MIECPKSPYLDPEVAMTGPRMPSTPEQTVPPTVTPLTPPHPLADESALERLFRAHFAALTEEARAKLGEGAASAAPRVVEAAFRQAWEERESLTTEPELTNFLHAAVQRAAARELSRRAAAHHLGGAGAGAAAHHAGPAALDVDQAWAHMSRQMHPENRGQAEQAQADVLRHEAAQHLSSLAKRRSWLVPALAGAAMVAVAGGGVWWMDRAGVDRRITRALAASDARSYPAAPGQFAIITLDDGTKVTIAPTSRLTVPKLFGTRDEMRAVKVDGAATFVVARKEQGPPFQVRAGKAAIVATGTTLDVRAYPDETTVVVQLREGEAIVKVGDVQRAVPAGRALLVDSGGAMREPTPAELAEALGWSSRRLSLTNRPLRDVVKQMNRLFGVDIKVPEAKLLDQPATVDVSLDSLRTAIAQVEQSTGAAFKYDGRTMLFQTKEPGKGKKQK